MKNVSFVALLGVAAIVGSCAHHDHTHLLVQAEGNTVRIPVTAVSDGTVHFFSFDDRGTTVDFLVRADGTGTLHAHLDACYSCYRYRRGFVVEGSDLVCVACRLAYAIEDEVWDYVGACAPIAIHAEIEGPDLVIRRSLLERASRYF